MKDYIHRVIESPKGYIRKLSSYIRKLFSIIERILWICWRNE